MSLDADIVCFDLEDSVPLNEKQTAREFVSEALDKKEDHGNRNVYVRINSHESGIAMHDLDAIVSDEIEGVVVPKVNNENEVSQASSEINRIGASERNDQENRNYGVNRVCSGTSQFVSIATADLRVKMLVFGVFDFLNDMGTGVCSRWS